ncbi:hypothetical protein KCU99_g6929, partial [Aureobasidium melanogenum]
MDDDETRRLILRLQMEDLASIWASSTTSTDDGTELDADVSLRLYRHELRTADQQIDDGVSARAAAQDELRQRDAIRADREEARRLFQELNPDEPLPEPSKPDQLLLTDHSISSNAPVKDETSSALGPLQSSGQPDMRASSSLSPHPVTASTSSVKRSADHLDTIFEPSSKKQASERIDRAASPSNSPCTLESERTQLEADHGATTNSDVPTQSSALAPSTPRCLKRPAQAENITPPSVKRQEISPQSSSLAFEDIQSATGETTTSVASDLATFDPIFAMFGSNYRPVPTSHPDSRSVGSPAALLETSAVESSPAPKQSFSLVQEAEQTVEVPPDVDCVICCRRRRRSETYMNSCGHIFCKKCANELFVLALRDDTLWPPQCCKQEMPFENVRHFLQADMEPQVRAREVEMATAPLERVYCATCSMFIPKDHIQERKATCPSCKLVTCVECTRNDHTGDCQQDLKQARKELQALAAEEGWKKCSACHMIVEHNTGCNHMM